MALKILSITAGIVLVCVSLIACGVYLIAIIDPVGAKMADDNDPFGEPPSRLYLGSALCISAAVGVGGAYLILKPSIRRERTLGHHA